MNIYITDKIEIRKIQLKSWDGSNWSPDMFADLVDTVPNDYPISEQQLAEAPDFASAAMTDADYRETVAWWEDEIAKYNAHDGSSWFVEHCDDLEAEWAKGIEYALFAD